MIGGRLFRRVVLHGVALIGISALGVAALFVVVVMPHMERDITELGTWFAREACGRPRANLELSDLPIGVALYDETGASLARSRPWVPDRLSARTLAHVAAGDGFTAIAAREVASACEGVPGRFVVIAGPTLGLARGRFAGSIALLIAAIVCFSIPLARSIVRPLRDVMDGVERFGRGELGARARVVRDDEIGELARAFNSMAAGLERRILAEKELMGNLSHELRTPLARVRVVLESARENPERAASSLHEIARDLADLERLTEDILATIKLDFASTGSAQIPFHPTPISLVPLARRALARAVESRRGRELSLEAPEALSPVVGDPVLLSRVFENLVANALDYSLGAVQLVLYEQLDRIVIDVRDQGIGIEPADRELIFEPFFRTGRSRTRSTGGVGLGLTLCRRIVQLHGGTIEALGEAGFGTTMRVQFPAATNRLVHESRGPVATATAGASSTT